MYKFSKSVFVFLFCAIVLFGCNSHKKPTVDTVKINAERRTSLTLFEERLISLVQESENLARDISQKKITPLEARMRLNELEKVWTEFALEHPENLDTQILYGKFLRSANFNEAAYKVFFNLDKKNPNLAIIKQQLSTYETEHNDFKKAYLHIKEAISLEPNTEIYQAQLGELLFKVGDELVRDNEISKTQKDFEMLSAFKAASRSNNLEFLIRYGQAFYDVETPDFNEALLVWETVENLAQTELKKDEARLHIVNFLIELNRFDDANLALQKISTKNYSKQYQALKILLENKKSKILNSQNLSK